MKNQNQRLYFTDPIVALYMMKKFGVKFDNGDFHSISTDVQCLGFYSPWKSKEKYYVAEKSEPIFEPKVNDTMQVYLAGKERIYTFSKNSKVHWSWAKIIMRDGKHFFQSL